MKVLILINDWLDKNSGVVKKVYWQYKAFQKLGIESFISLGIQSEDKSVTYLIESQKGKKILYSYQSKGEGWMKRLFNLFYSQKERLRKLKSFIIENDIDTIYIRKPIFTYEFILFLSKLKKNNCKIFLEIPTYPYMHEFFVIMEQKKNILKKLIILFIVANEFFLRYLLRFYIDRIVLIAWNKKKKKLWGIPIISIPNGINLQDIKIRQFKTRKPDELIISTATSIQPWQGIERLIRSMGSYKRSEGRIKVLFRIASFDSIDKLKELAKREDVINDIGFCGPIIGKQLDEFYSSADICMGAMGVSKYNSIASSLKAKEYLGRGIPFITSYDEYMMNEDSRFFFKVPMDESLINFDQVVCYLNEISNPEFSMQMRRYAESNFSWESIFSNYLLEFLKLKAARD